MRAHAVLERTECLLLLSIVYSDAGNIPELTVEGDFMYVFAGIEERSDCPRRAFDSPPNQDDVLRVESDTSGCGKIIPTLVVSKHVFLECQIKPE